MTKKIATLSNQDNPIFMTRDEIAARMLAIREQAMCEAKISLVDILIKLEDARLVAEEKGRADHMVKATMSMAELLGFCDSPMAIVVKNDAKAVQHEADDMSPDFLESLPAEIRDSLRAHAVKAIEDRAIDVAEPEYKEH